jgi:hypothetical protein
MIPINIAIIGAKASPGTGLFRGCLYGLGMAVAYGVLGIAAITLGMKFGQLNSSYLFNFIIAVIFFILALAMLGVFNLDLSRFNFINAKKLSSFNFFLPFIYYIASFLEKFNLPFLSVPIALTKISSPTLTTSSVFSTLSLASLEICTNPSHPGQT